MRQQQLWPLLLATLLLAAVWPNWTQAAIDPSAVQKLLAEDGAAYDAFGTSVFASGNTAVIGAYKDSDKGRWYGSAYVFVQAVDGTWHQQAKLTAEDGAPDDYFGWSVAISANTAVIGALGDDDKGSSSGAAYVFVRTEDGAWSQQVKLTAEDGALDDHFGWSVAISENTAVIGTAYKGSSSGAAYVFVRAADGTWSQQAKLIAEDGAAGNEFGWSVAISAGTAVIGADKDDDKGMWSGSAYVFVRAADGTWTQQAKLLAPDGAAGNKFGWSVSFAGDTAVIGENTSSSAYVFVRTADGTWTQQAKLTANDGEPSDAFGFSVSFAGDTAMIGAVGDSDKGIWSGSAYVFVRAADGAWMQQAKLLAPDGAAEDSFGYSVSVSGNTAVIGAYGDDDKGSMSGSAYMFSSSVNQATVSNLAPVYKLLLKGK